MRLHAIESTVLTDDQMTISESAAFEALLLNVRTASGNECMYLNREEAGRLRDILEDWINERELEAWTDELESKWLADRGVY